MNSGAYFRAMLTHLRELTFKSLDHSEDFKALNSVHPITHAVASTVKRVVVITSIIVFRNVITPSTAIGFAVALVGVLLNSIAKNYFPEKKRARSKTPAAWVGIH